jgi:hypothetical protein
VSASGHYLCISGRYGPPESRPHLITRSLHFWIFLFAPSRKTHALDFETKSFSGCIPSSPLSKPLASFLKVQLGGLILQSGRTRGISCSDLANPTTTKSCIPAMLYRNFAARSALRALSSSNASVARSSLSHQICKAQMTSSARNAIRPSAPSFALTAHKPVTTALVRFSSSSAHVRTWI